MPMVAALSDNAQALLAVSVEVEPEFFAPDDASELELCGAELSFSAESDLLGTD